MSRVLRTDEIALDPDTCATSKPGVFAAGDIVTGGATLISAMGADRRAATAINRYLRAGGGEAELANGGAHSAAGNR